MSPLALSGDIYIYIYIYIYVYSLYPERSFALELTCEGPYLTHFSVIFFDHTRSVSRYISYDHSYKISSNLVTV